VSRRAFRARTLAFAFVAAGCGLVACSDHPRGADPAEVSTVELVNRCGPSVVAVHFALTSIGPVMDHEEQGAGGSGFVVDQHGRIVTNYHLVAAALADTGAHDGMLGLVPQASLFVSFADDPDKRLPVRVRGANPDFDLALLELVNPEDLPDVHPLPLGDSDKVKAGERAIAIGSPFGLHATVTSGIVSAIKRGRPGLVGIEIPYIQTDAAINPGNSGGPLFNSRGEVIGINNAILASPLGPQAFIGVGFAVPINLLKENMDGLMAGGLSGIAAAISNIASRPRLGVSGALHVDDYPEALRQELGLPEHGVVILDVSPGGPADEAGLIGPLDAVTFGETAFPAGGDVITRANGQAVRRFIDLQQLVLEHEAGDVITLGVWRDGEERRVEVTLELVHAEETKAALDPP
jgi:serine protease Do